MENSTAVKNGLNVMIVVKHRDPNTNASNGQFCLARMVHGREKIGGNGGEEGSGIEDENSESDDNEEPIHCELMVWGTDCSFAQRRVLNMLKSTDLPMVITAFACSQRSSCLILTSGQRRSRASKGQAWLGLCRDTHR